MYYDYLWRMLQPLGVYSGEGYNGGELKVLGMALDRVQETLEEYGREGNPMSAEGEGLAVWESLFPIFGAANGGNRRDVLKTLFQTVSRGSNRQALLETLNACGMDVSLGETGTKFQVLVSFNNPMEITADPVFQLWLLEQVLPCHLVVIVVMDYVSVSTGEMAHERVTLDYLRHRSQEEWEALLGAYA